MATLHADTGASMNVSGCVVLNGTAEIQDQPGQDEVRISSSSCDISVSESFSIKGNNECNYAVTKREQFVKISSINSCGSDGTSIGIVAGVAVAIVFLLVILILILVFLIPSLRHRIFPFTYRSAKHTNKEATAKP
mmetsp:Transcript_24292/g.26988  ORF Transcript_24292/g.26988 Transcript_24292/m.26988 type:complete len:136 (+) Transcript_24292:531-938(+)